MYAEYQRDGTIAVSGSTRREEFERIRAGIGWPDLDPGCICVVGERTDERYHALWEKQGGLWEIGDAALEAKDRLLVDRIFVDARDDLSTSYLRTLEGLTFYDEGDSNSTGFPPGSSSEFPFYRDRDTIAAVVPVRERVAANYRSALERTREIIMRGRLLVHESNCPRLVYTLRQPVEELLGSPVMKALVWVVTALEDSRGDTSLEDPPREPWYGNAPRNIR
jgi:hypothetical protein